MKVANLVSPDDREEAIWEVNKRKIQIPETELKLRGICRGQEYMRILHETGYTATASGIYVIGDVDLHNPLPWGVNLDFEGMRIYGRVSFMNISPNCLSLKNALLMGDGFIAVKVTVIKNMFWPKNWDEIVKQQPNNILISDLHVKGQMLFSE